jgi:hypothetical protein
MARLRSVGMVHELNRNASFGGLVLNPISEPSERPSMQSTVHVRTVIQPLTDVRQVFEDDNRIIELLGILNSLSRRLLDNIRQSVLVVVESVITSPLCTVAFLQAFQRGVHLLAELSSARTVEQKRLFRRSVLREGTARQEFGFADVEANRCWVIRHLGGFDLVFNSDVQHPVRPVLLQPELTGRQLAVEQVDPEIALLWIDPQRNPEGVATPRLRHTPAELMSAVIGLIETKASVGESNRMIVSEFRSVVRVTQFRHVALESVFGVGRETVGCHNVVDCRLGICATLEGVFEGMPVGRHGSVKPTLFVRRRWRERSFKRLRGGGFGSHPTVQCRQPKQINTQITHICMVKSIRVEVEDDQHERLSEIKDRRGYTWKGLLLEGAKALDTDDTQ